MPRARYVGRGRDAKLSALYPFRQTLTAEMMRIAASSGSKFAHGAMRSNRPPMNVPTIEPSAMTRTKERFCPNTAKLRSRL